MGQYYKPCVMDRAKKAVVASLHPHNFMNGAKLTEHSYVGNNLVNAAMRLISVYKGKPFVWCGDYADERFVNKAGEKVNTYTLALMGDSLTPKEVSELGGESNFKYIVNYTKREYVKVPEKVKNELVFHPLPLLTADGNQRGGGDYWGENSDLVGIWAYDRIGVTNKRPHYKRLEVSFSE